MLIVSKLPPSQELPGCSAQPFAYGKSRPSSAQSSAPSIVLIVTVKDDLKPPTYLAGVPSPLDNLTYRRNRYVWPVHLGNKPARLQDFGITKAAGALTSTLAFADVTNDRTTLVAKDQDFLRARTLRGRDGH
jgi:hypothetical protein